MHHIKLSEGQDPQKVADIIGGTLIMVNGDVAIISGGDVSKLTA